MSGVASAAGAPARGRRSRTRAVPVLALLSLAAGLQVATQAFARSVGYGEGLGPHVAHLYAPWSILLWAARWYAEQPGVFLQAGSLGVGTAAVGLLALGLGRMWAANTARPHTTVHGSARWAERKDLEAAGLLPRARTVFEQITGRPAPVSSGLYVGGWEKKGVFHYLRHHGPEHVLVLAPTRSGKGVGLVLPTLLSWPESAVVTDLKGELWQLTAGWRQKHARSRVLRFEPAALEGSCAWNPLEEIRLGAEHEVADVQNLATLLVDPDGKGLDSHWQRTAFALLVGVILHALHRAREDRRTATLASVDRMLADPRRPVQELWEEMAKAAHPVVASAARDMLDRSEEEAGSVLSTAKSYLSLYRDPVVERNTARSDFRIRDLMHHESPVSLYIVTRPTDQARLRPLVRVLLDRIVRGLADRIEFENGRPRAPAGHRLLLLLDEFPSLGRMPILEQSLAFLAGYGIQCFLVCQDLAQLRSREHGYGPDETITSNCHVQVAFAPNRLETAEHLSKLTGQTTVVKEQITTSGARIAALQGHVSRSYHEVSRPLLTADECLRMPGPRRQNTGDAIEEAGDMLVSVAGFPAIYGKQPLYFQDPIFVARVEVPVPARSDRLRIPPEEECPIRL
jgi:type IV secretion system protein VirD4